MKKYIIIAIIIIVIGAVFFAIMIDQKDAEQEGLYHDEDDAENKINKNEAEDEIEEDEIIINENKNEDKIQIKNSEEPDGKNNEESGGEKDLEKEEKNELSGKSFIQCLADADVVIYGTKTCPACASLINSLGGYEAVDLIYVDCNEEWDRCSSEMQTNYVPEIQIKRELYSGSRSPSSIGDFVNCEI